MKKALLFLTLLLGGISVAQCLNYTQLLNASFRKVAFFDANYGFTFGQGTLMKTNDGGANWTFVQIPNNRYDTETLKSYDILDENTAIIVGQAGTIIKTSDKGQTWTPISLMINGNENINSIDFVNSEIGYLTAYTYTPPEVSYFMKTVDGGLTWTQIPTYFSTDISFFSDITIHFLDELHGFAWSGFYLYKTINGGNTWTQMQNPSGDIFNAKRISTMKVSENGTIVLSFYDGTSYFYKSTDFGTSWELITNLSPSNNAYINNPGFEIKQNKILTVGELNNTLNKNFIINDLTNNQLTSFPINTRLGYQSDIFFIDLNIGFIIDRGGTFWADAPGRKFLKTTNGGINWNEFDSFSFIDSPTNSNINVKVNNATTLTLTKQDNSSFSLPNFTLYTSIDSGATWQLKLIEIELLCFLLRAENNYISYIRLTNQFDAGEGYSIYESFDLGNTWTNSHVDGSNISMYDIVQLDLNTLTCVYGQEIYFSYNKGQTWTHVSVPVVPNIVLNRCKIINLNEIYIWGRADGWPTTYDYYLYKTVNQGQSWQLVTSIPDNNGADLGATALSTFFGSNYAFVSTGGNTYFRINLDNGTYQPVPFNHPVPDQVFLNENDFKILNDNKWLINAEYGYKISTDQGLTWIDKNCLVCSNDIIYDDATGILISYDSDHAVERIGNYTLTTPVIYGNSTVDLNDSENYFVPLNPLANVEWSLNSGGTITNNFNNYVQVNWTQSGQHIIKAKYTNECGESSYYELSVNVIGPLSVNENLASSKVIVFPNPFKDEINIQGKFENTQSEILIYNSNGQIVYSDKIDKNDRITVSNLSNLKSGTYFLIVKNNNKSFVNKLIKE